MAINPAAINAYKGIAQQLSGLESRDNTSHLGQFKQLVEGVGGIDATQDTVPSGLGSIVGGAATSTIHALNEAESQAAKAAAGKGDPVQVAHAMNVASLSAEQFTTVLGKGLAAYQEFLRLPL
jgi:flagellar hook-basal body complex protein FliE